MTEEIDPTTLTPARVHFDDTDPDHDGFWIMQAPNGAIYLDDESYRGMQESGVIDGEGDTYGQGPASDFGPVVVIGGKLYRDINHWELNFDD